MSKEEGPTCECCCELRGGHVGVKSPAVRKSPFVKQCGPYCDCAVNRVLCYSNKLGQRLRDFQLRSFNLLQRLFGQHAAVYFSLSLLHLSLLLLPTRYHPRRVGGFLGWKMRCDK